MPSSYTTSLRFEMQAAGENLNTWGAPRLNTALSRIDKAIAGRAAVALNGVDYILTASNTADDDARAAVLEFTGTGGVTVTLPSVTKTYLVQNSCASGAVVLTTGAGLTASVDVGDVVQITCDGINVEPTGFRVGGALLSIKDYIASVVVGSISGLPAVAGNAGKFMYTNGSSALWRTPVVADVSDYASDQATKATAALGRSVAFAIAL